MLNNPVYGWKPLWTAAVYEDLSNDVFMHLYWNTLAQQIPLTCRRLDSKNLYNRFLEFRQGVMKQTGVTRRAEFLSSCMYPSPEEPVQELVHLFMQLPTACPKHHIQQFKNGLNVHRDFYVDRLESE